MLFWCLLSPIPLGLDREKMRPCNPDGSDPESYRVSQPGGSPTCWQDATSWALAFSVSNARVVLDDHRTAHRAGRLPDAQTGEP